MSGFREFNENFMKNYDHCPWCKSMSHTIAYCGDFKCMRCGVKYNKIIRDEQPLELDESSKRHQIQDPQRTSEPDADLSQFPAIGHILGECDWCREKYSGALPQIRAERKQRYYRNEPDGKVYRYRD